MMFLLIFSAFFLTVNADTIRQCTCSELDSCKANVVNEIQGCFDYCKTQLNFTLDISLKNLDLNGVKQCLGQGDNNTYNCFEAINHLLCTSQNNVTINKSDTLEGANSNIKLNFIKQRILVRAEAYSNGVAYGQGLLSIINELFSGTGSQMISCVRDCMSGSNGLNCVKNLGCGVLNPDSNYFLASTATCKNDLKNIKMNLCQCIKAAGNNFLNC
uniref:Uncharacterized protein n=1 Tax=Acrobeloides nanus TaxID=290746 RepID=A0A914D428_9BILA